MDGGGNGCGSGLLGVNPRNKLHFPDRTAFAFRAHAAPSGECNYYVCICMYVCMYVCMDICSLLPRPPFCSSVCVQYNTWKRKSGEKQGGSPGNTYRMTWM